MIKHQYYNILYCVRKMVMIIVLRMESSEANN